MIKVYQLIRKVSKKIAINRSKLKEKIGKNQKFHISHFKSNLCSLLSSFLLQLPKTTKSIKISKKTKSFTAEKSKRDVPSRHAMT